MTGNRLAWTFGAISLVVGALLTLKGVGQMEWPTVIPFDDTALLSDSALRRYLLLVLGVLSVICICVIATKRSVLVIASITASVLTLLCGAIWPLVAVAWFATASAVLGRKIGRILSPAENAPAWGTAFLLGSGTYGTAVGLLAHFAVNFPGLYASALALPLILFRNTFAELCSHLRVLTTRRAPTAFGDCVLELAVATVALVHIVITLLPEVAYDALTSHLFVPAHLALRHQWGFDVTTYVWAVMPMLGDWIFAIGYMLGGETAARLINVGFVLTIAWYIRELVLWAGGTVSGARWAVLIFLSTPLTFTESSSLFIESVWTTFVVAGTLAILRACSSVEETKHNLLIGSALLGFAAAAKAVTFTVIPALLIVLICRYKVWTKAELLRAALLGIAAFLLVGAIPYVTAWELTGNPVFPLFNKIFKSPFYPPENFEAPAVFGKGVTWDILYRMTFESGKYLEGRTGSAGFQWLLLFFPTTVLLFGFRLWKGVGLFLVGVLCVYFTFSSTAYLRYVFPSFAIFAACVGIAIGFVNSNRSIVYPALCFVGSAVVALNLLFINAGAFYSDFQLKSIFSEDKRHGYLQTRLPIRNAVELVNKLNTVGSPVAVFAQPLTAGLAADALYPNWYNLRFYSLIQEARSEQAIVDVLASNGVDFVIFDSNWGDAEKRRLIEAATEEIAELGTVTVRRIATAYRFQSELLKYPDFESYAGWSSVPGGFSRVGNGIAVSVSSPAFQSVPVMQKRRYLYSVKARCNGLPTQGRMQVNWVDAKSQFIGAEIRVFDCTDSSAEHKMEIIAPPKATMAVVYASGHTSIPLVFERVSFRQ